jgi:hypothetical protein
VRRDLHRRFLRSFAMKYLLPKAVTKYLTEPEQQALIIVATTLGPRWKDEIRRAWLRGHYGGLGLMDSGRRYLESVMDKLSKSQFMKLRVSDTPEAEKPYAFEVELVFHDGSTKRTKYVCRNEQEARRKGGAVRSVREVIVLEPMTEEQYHRAYGHGSIRR